jgi:hypothetical protein
VPQCESEAYVWATPRAGGPEGTLDFHFAVENPQGIAAKALAAILADSLPGEPLSTITAIPGDVVYSLFGRELSMGKNLGPSRDAPDVPGVRPASASSRGRLIVEIASSLRASR